MRFLITVLLSLLSTILLAQVCTACPPDEDVTEKAMGPLRNKLKKDVCGQGIKIGSADDVKWLRTKLLPYYISKKWLTKDPPKGWEKETDKLMKKCHKDTYDYCSESDRKAAGDCVKKSAGSLMLKYGATAMAYCPILDTIFKEWPDKHEEKALDFISAFCKTKGKTC